MGQDPKLRQYCNHMTKLEMEVSVPAPSNASPEHAGSVVHMSAQNTSRMELAAGIYYPHVLEAAS